MSTDAPTMTIVRNPGDELLRQAAALHCRLLPGSAITRFGDHYALSFYRYVSRSPAEAVYAAVDSDAVIAAAVLSLRPRDLQRRLLSQTPLLRYMAMHPLAACRVARERLFAQGKGEIDPAVPEVIAIFTLPARQRSGLGARLLREIENDLSARGLSRYCLRSEDATGNRALAFYDRQGFVVVGRSGASDAGFRIMVRQIGGEADRAGDA